MAKYTVELRDIHKSGLKIFDFPYAFYDETKKPEFEERFINHFYFREIGTETVGRFQHYLKCKCDEVLPYYNLLFKTALYEYDIKNNYNLTETFTKTTGNNKTVTGNATQNTDTTNNEHLNGSVISNRDVDTNGSKTNTLESTTDHSENIDFTKDETTNETSKTTNNVETLIDDVKVGSDTPNGLLSMADIKNKVYASKADVQDGKTTTSDITDATADKTGNSTEATERTSNDTVDATSRDTYNDATNENGSQTTNNTTTGSGSVDTTTNSNQTETDNGTETYTLDRVGDIGVDTTPDKLRKHIEIQKVFTTIYTQFFDECEDLFMQIY